MYLGKYVMSTMAAVSRSEVGGPQRTSRATYYYYGLEYYSYLSVELLTTNYILITTDYYVPVE